jgi:glycosyltransferase involved in cell wall biosynthesis
VRPDGARPTALLVSPIPPAAGGNGLAMRAGAFLDALAADHDVTLLLVPVAGGGGGGEPSDFARHRVRHFGILPLGDGILDPLYSLGARLLDPAEHLAALRAYPRPAPCRWATTPALDAAVTAAGGASFDTVVVLRSYLAPYAAPFLSEPARRLLDLDDDERLTLDRLSQLHARHGQPKQALLAAAEAAKYAVHERAWLPRFDLLLAASEVHEAAVRERHPGLAVSVVPNTVEVPETVRRDPRSPALRLLFVGNLGYEPNVDAALWIAGELVPRLRRDGSIVELCVAGSHPVPEVAALAGPGIEIHADPVDLAPHYAWADLALAPIRAGGGTRIKILEAFAARVPVVATSIGAEGLAVDDGEHLLLADDGHDFATACRRLKEDPRLGERLAANALDRVRERYSRAEGKTIIQKLLSRST